MTALRRHCSRSAAAALLGAVLLLAAPARARESGEPQRFHVVYPGQRLSTIAKRYKVSVDAIRVANGLGRAARLKPGDKLTIPGLDDPDGSRARALYPPQHPTDNPTVPASTRKAKDGEDDADTDADDGPRTHTVYAGQRLESIAKRYKVQLKALCAANGITRRTKLHAGQVLVVPRSGDPTTDKDDGDDDLGGKRGAHKLPRLGLRKGYLDLFNYATHFHGYALDKKGKVTPVAETEVSRLFGATGPRPMTDPRLIKLLAKVSDKFGSRPIRVVSGYRTRSFYQDSRHKLSRAVDFSIPGIDNVVLRDYLRTLPAVGVGYYPNSSFVHLDVRDVATYWVDYAGPGESPRKTSAHDHGHDRDHDQEAEGDLHDPEVFEGDRPGPSSPPSLEVPPPATDPAAPADSSAAPSVDPPSSDSQIPPK